MLIVLIREPNLPPNFYPGTVRTSGPPEDRCYRAIYQSADSFACSVISYGPTFLSICRARLLSIESTDVKKANLHYNDPKEAQMETHL